MEKFENIEQQPVSMEDKIEISERENTSNYFRSAFKKVALLSIMALNGMTALDHDFRNKVIEFMYGDDPRVAALEDELNSKMKEQEFSNLKKERHISNPYEVAPTKDYVDKNGKRHLEQKIAMDSGEQYELIMEIDNKATEKNHRTIGGEVPFKMKAVIIHTDGTVTDMFLESSGRMDNSGGVSEHKGN